MWTSEAEVLVEKDNSRFRSFFQIRSSKCLLSSEYQGKC